MSLLFVTGASGFVGSRLVRQLLQRGHGVVGLSRSQPRAYDCQDYVPIRGDLLESHTFESHLEKVDTVIHLAAATGKATAHHHFTTNVQGTRNLVDACHRYGVPRFVFVSTIAVKFPSLTRYPYAQSKRRAEAIVSSSGLECVTVRPTIVLGPGSPILDGLRKMTSLPFTPVFGPGKARVQPIFVNDLADLIVSVIETPQAPNAILEFGGPDVLTIRELLSRIGRQVRGRSPRMIRVPLSIVLPALIVLEPLLYSVLPVTYGQLASFRFDGIATPNALMNGRRDQLTGIDEMLGRSLEA